MSRALFVDCVGKLLTHMLELGPGTIQKSCDAKNGIFMIETIVNILGYVLQTGWWNNTSTINEESSIIYPERVRELA